MNATELAIDGLAAQELDSLCACIARGQTPDTYQDIIEKLRTHCDQLPPGRRDFWIEQCQVVAVVLFPLLAKKRGRTGTIHAEAGSSSNPTGERS